MSVRVTAAGAGGNYNEQPNSGRFSTAGSEYTDYTGGSGYSEYTGGSGYSEYTDGDEYSEYSGQTGFTGYTGYTEDHTETSSYAPSAFSFAEGAVRCLAGLPVTRELIGLKLPFGAWEPDTLITDTFGNPMFSILDVQHNAMGSYEAILGDENGHKLCYIKRRLITAYWKDSWDFCTYKPNFPGQPKFKERDMYGKSVWPYSCLNVLPLKCKYEYCVHRPDLSGTDTMLTAMHAWLGSMTVMATPMVRLGKWQIDFHQPDSGAPEVSINQSKNLLEVDSGNDLLASLCIAYAFDKALCQPLVTIIGYEEKEHMDDDDDDSLDSRMDPDQLGVAIDRPRDYKEVEDGISVQYSQFEEEDSSDEDSLGDGGGDDFSKASSKKSFFDDKKARNDFDDYYDETRGDPLAPQPSYYDEASIFGKNTTYGDDDDDEEDDDDVFGSSKRFDDDDDENTTFGNQSYFSKGDSSYVSGKQESYYGNASQYSGTSGKQESYYGNNSQYSDGYDDDDADTYGGDFIGKDDDDEEEKSSFVDDYRKKRDAK